MGNALPKGGWEALPAMASKRCACAAVVHDNKVMVLGGFDGSSSLASAELFDFLSGHWRALPAMASKRAGCAAVVHDNSVMFLGGHDGSSYLATAEKLSWEVQPLPNEGGRGLPSRVDMQ